MTNISQNIIYQIEVSCNSTRYRDSSELLWKRLKYYYNHGALEFNKKIIEECKLLSNRSLIPFHFGISNIDRSKIIETQVDSYPDEKILFLVMKNWTYEELLDILNAMDAVFSDYVGSGITSKLLLGCVKM